MESEKVGLKLYIQKKTKITASGPIASWQMMGKQWKQWQTILGGSKITADGDLLLGRKAITNLDSVLKNRDITLLTKVCIVKGMVLSVVMYGCESWTIKKAEHQRNDVFELWCWKKLLRVLRLQGDPTSPFWRKSVFNIHWKDWCWRWNINALATWCESVTHLKRPQCWERLKAGGEGDDRRWGAWMASQTQWTCIRVNSGSWWWTGRPDVLQSMGLQRVRHDWVTELNRTLIECVLWVYFKHFPNLSPLLHTEFKMALSSGFIIPVTSPGYLATGSTASLVISVLFVVL